MTLYDRKPPVDPARRFEELAEEIEEVSGIAMIMAEATEERPRNKALFALAKHLERVAEEGLQVSRELTKGSPRKTDLPGQNPTKLEKASA